MKIIFGGALITSGTGKIGGTVIQGGPYGPIARNNFKPMNRQANNSFQPCIKEVFTNVAKTWHTLSGGQVAAWNAYTTPPLSGYSSFLKTNIDLLRTTGIIILDPPILPALPTAIILTSAIPSPIPAINLTYTGFTNANLNNMLIFVSINNNPGATKLVKSTLRMFLSTPLITGVNTYLLVPNIFGIQIQPNTSNFIAVRLLDTVTGVLQPFRIIQFNT